MANEHAAIHNDLIHPCDEVLDRARVEIWFSLRLYSVIYISPVDSN